MNKKTRKALVIARRTVKVALVATVVVVIRNHYAPTPNVEEMRAFIYPDGSIIIKA